MLNTPPFKVSEMHYQRQRERERESEEISILPPLKRVVFGHLVISVKNTLECFTSNLQALKESNLNKPCLSLNMQENWLLCMAKVNG